MTDPVPDSYPSARTWWTSSACATPPTTSGPDPSDPAQRVALGTSGHRGSSRSGTFTDAHVAAISEAVCRSREGAGAGGPLFLGRDTHVLSEPAFRTIVEVLAAHGVDVVVDADDGATPTPVTSHATLTHMLIGDPALAERMGAAGRARAVEHFAWPAIARRTVEVYERLGIPAAAGP
jgi:hypothetical protein